MSCRTRTKASHKSSSFPSGPPCGCTGGPKRVDSKCSSRPEHRAPHAGSLELWSFPFPAGFEQAVEVWLDYCWSPEQFVLLSHSFLLGPSRQLNSYPTAILLGFSMAHSHCITTTAVRCVGINYFISLYNLWDGKIIKNERSLAGAT